MKLRNRYQHTEYNFNQMASRMGITLHTNIDEVERRRLINKYRNANYMDVQTRRMFKKDINRQTRSYSSRVNPLTTKGRVPHRITTLARDYFDSAIAGSSGTQWSLGDTVKGDKKSASRGTVGSKIFQTPLQTPPDIMSTEADVKDRPGFWRRTMRWLRGR